MLFLQHHWIRNTKQADPWVPEYSEICEQHFWDRRAVSSVLKSQGTVFQQKCLK